jgi:cytochrome c-type biogenesis protein
MLAVTVAIAVGYDAFAERASRHGPLFTRIAGVVLVLAGIGQLYFAVTI